MHRGGAALRGLVLLYVIIALAIAATALSKTSTAAKHATSAPAYHGATMTSVGAKPPRPSPSPTAMIVAEATATATVTAIASPTPQKRKFVRWTATVTHDRPILDAATGMDARVEQVQVRAGRSLKLLLRVRIHAAVPHASYNAGNFYAVDDRGQTYSVTSRTAGHPALGAGRFSRGRTVSAWLGFVIPARVTGVHVIWNDENRLFPPGTVASVQVRRVTGFRTVR